MLRPYYIIKLFALTLDYNTLNTIHSLTLLYIVNGKFVLGSAISLNTPQFAVDVLSCVLCLFM